MELKVDKKSLKEYFIGNTQESQFEEVLKIFLTESDLTSASYLNDRNKIVAFFLIFIKQQQKNLKIERALYARLLKKFAEKNYLTKENQYLVKILISLVISEIQIERDRRQQNVILIEMQMLEVLIYTLKRIFQDQLEFLKSFLAEPSRSDQLAKQALTFLAYLPLGVYENNSSFFPKYLSILEQLSKAPSLGFPGGSFFRELSAQKIRSEFLFIFGIDGSKSYEIITNEQLLLRFLYSLLQKFLEDDNQKFSEAAAVIESCLETSEEGSSASQKFSKMMKFFTQSFLSHILFNQERVLGVSSGILEPRPEP